MPGPDLGQGQIVALAMFTAGCVLLMVAAWRARHLRATVLARVRSVLAGALMITAGLALLAVRRLDPAALSRVVTDLQTAALLAAHPAHARWKELR